MADRDNFSRKDVQTLAVRVGLRCSDPTCRRVTNAAHSAPDKILTIGDAAHIHGARPGAPRYDPNQTPAQRRHISNGIWLCVMHARIVDREDSQHSPSLLRRWKDDAEKEWRSILTERLELAQGGAIWLGSWSWVLSFSCPIAAALTASWVVASFFAGAAVVCSTVSVSLRLRERALARHLSLLAHGTGSAALVASFVKLRSVNFRELAGPLASIWVTLLLATLGINAAMTSSKMPEPDFVAENPSADAMIGIGQDELQPQPQQGPAAIPGEIIAGAPGPPRTMNFMSSGDPSDPLTWIPRMVFQEVNNDFIGTPGPPKRQYLSEFRPWRPRGSRAVVHVTNMELIALGDTAIIGGLPPNAPRDAEPEPVVIEEGVVDERIKLDENVYLQHVKRKRVSR